MSKSSPREVPSHDDFFMSMAFWAASLSKSPSWQTGAVIVDADNALLGWGYNDVAKIFHNYIDWNSSELSEFMDHAESNAIDYCLNPVAGATMYATIKPCPTCMKKIMKFDFKKVIYFKPKSAGKDYHLKSEEMAKAGSITLTEFDGNLNWMRDRIKFMDQKGVFDHL